MWSYCNWIYNNYVGNKGSGNILYIETQKPFCGKIKYFKYIYSVVIYLNNLVIYLREMC